MKLIWMNEPNELQKNQIEREFARLMDSFNVDENPEIKINWNGRKRSCAGTAHYSDRRIELNSRLLTEHPEHLLQTFVHELCHILAVDLYGNPAGAGHGRPWRRLMKKCGYAPDRCHQLEGTKKLKAKRKKWMAACGCRSHIIGAVRKKRLDENPNYYKCGDCSGKIVVVGRSNEIDFTKQVEQKS